MCAVKETIDKCFMLVFLAEAATKVADGVVITQG
jgi:hypothetical protein